MSIARHHAEWLSLVPVSGPFLSLPVLLNAFPQGLDAHDADHARLLRAHLEEWEAGMRMASPPAALHNAWIRFVLTETLELDSDLLLDGPAIPQTLQLEVPEHGELLRPSLVLQDPTTQKPRMLIRVYPRGQSLTSYVAGSRWKASPDTRMTDLLHATGIRLGLVTNGEHWMLIDAQRGETTGYSSWYASLWREEKITLQAFRSLLSMSRFFSVAEDQTLESLLSSSAANQQEVTDQLGAQVRRAVEVLIQSLDRADQDFGRELLADVAATELYESSLTVMMRLVFLFCAEERELIPTRPYPVYELNYSVSAIAQQLREIADQHGEELLERRHDAWPRLLSAFRAIYGGLSHDDVYLPAYGGRLFDPDRFPFLEGRKAGTNWRDAEATPLPVNNRTVLHLLEALQVLQVKVPGGGPAEARRLSFRALDIEQIGHVYEGLLDHTAQRAEEPYVGLIGSGGLEPEVPVRTLLRALGDWVLDTELDAAARSEQDPEQRQQLEEQLLPPSAFLDLLKEVGKRTPKQILRNVRQELDSQQQARFRSACQTPELYEQLRPLMGLIRDDSFGYPVVIPTGSIFVTAGTDRRSSGTHYTPRSLTEPIVQYTLEPLVYVGPAEGKPKAEWRLKSASELLDLKICDMACGSGAFLVQAARYMSERLMEAWDEAERVSRTENRGLGFKSADSGGQNDDDPELSGSGGVGGGDGLGGGMLSGHAELSERRAIWTDESDSAGGGVDSSEYRRGSRTRAHEGVSESPEHRTRVADGSADASAVGAASRDSGGTRSKSDDDSVRANQSNDFPSSTVAQKTHLPRTPNPGPRTPFPRITPEGKPSTGEPNESLIPDDPAERTTYAMRIVAQRCLYGVDINPLATEMAKLSLWLLTLAKDKPFEFLDHAIRCGDSLVGLHDLEQLRHFSLKPDADDAVLFKGPLDNAVDEAINLRLKLEDMPSNTVEDVEAQEKLLKEAEDKIARLRCAADLLVAGEFWGEGTKDKQEKVRHAAVIALRYVENGPTEEFAEKSEKERRGQKMFHWALEFPEVIVNRGGFDAFVGNPPFLGGLRISEVLGDQYNTWLVTQNEAASRKADLCAYFFVRASVLVNATGHFGLLGSALLAETLTRKAGLDVIVSKGGSIFRAASAFHWPGDASTNVVMAWITMGQWQGSYILNDYESDGISTSLDAARSKRPVELLENNERCFQGVNPLGMGFIIDITDADEWLAADPELSTVVRPYISGKEINDSINQEPVRSVIHFGERSHQEASQYSRAFAHLKESVYPERMQKDGTKYPRMVDEWWKFWHGRQGLFTAIHDNQVAHVLACARVTKYISIVRIPSEWVCSDKVIVFVMDQWPDFMLLQSSFHDVWARNEGSARGDTFNYVVKSCFLTFARPRSVAGTSTLGADYYSHRKSTMLNRREGLTKTYNRFHDPEESASDIQKLRDLHVEMDQAVAAAYGWTDLKLGHDFHETKQGLRFTISESARRDVLQRLLKLNHERYAEEVKQGLHDKKMSKAKKTGKPKKSKKSQPTTRMLFDDDDDEEGG